MPRLKQKSPEQIIAQSPIGDRLLGGVFKRNLASGALRLVEVNGQLQSHDKLGNSETKVQAVLASGYYGITSPNPDFSQAEVRDALITADQVPTAYYERHRRSDGQQDHGAEDSIEQQQKQLLDRLRGDQAESLSEWVTCLRAGENGQKYPDWFLVYVWESLKKMGDFDKEAARFKKRTTSTTAPWPWPDAKAVASVYETMTASMLRGDEVADDQLAKLLRSGSFPALYAHALRQTAVTGVTPELRQTTAGSWTRYPQIEGDYTPYYNEVDGEYVDDTVVDNAMVMRLARSLRGMDTGWCTAGSQTAAYLLARGDLYVYYTQDNDGRDTIPRVTVRMEEDRVAEVRGIEINQNLESSMANIVRDKLMTLPGGDEYLNKLEHVERLTEIEHRCQVGVSLAAADIMFLRGEVLGFGWREDPRVVTLLREHAVTHTLHEDFEAIAITYDHNAILDLNWNKERHQPTDSHLIYLIEQIDRLDDDHAASLIKQLRSADSPRLSDHVVRHAAELFRRGMSLIDIFHHGTTQRLIHKAANSPYVGGPYGHADIGTYVIETDETDAINRQLIAAGVRPAYVKEAQAVFRHDPIRPVCDEVGNVTPDDYLARLCHTIDDVVSSDRVKQLIFSDFLTADMDRLPAEWLESHIGQLVELGGNRRAITAELIERHHLTRWSLEFMGIERLVERGFDGGELERLYVAS